MTKICFKCKIEKDISEFYKHSKMFDGYLNKCKECAKKDTINNYQKNRNYYIEYDRKRNATPKRKVLRKDYIKKHPEIKYKSCIRYKNKFPEKYKASIIFHNAIRSGKIIRYNRCELCGMVCKPDGHHYDYSKPLDVLWCCKKCHQYIHKEKFVLVDE